MSKQVLVTVDRGETRVAMLEAAGDPPASVPAQVPAAARGDVPAGWRVAELYIERRGKRSIVGNIYMGKVDNVVPGLEAAFVDIGLEKNGFLHVDDIVMPGVEVARRGRGGSKGQRISELLKPGQEILVQVVKDPLKTKGARLAMQLSIAGRYLVYVPQGEGVGVSRRLDDKERDRLRKEARRLELPGGAIIRTAAAGAVGADFERETKYLLKLWEILQQPRHRGDRAGHGLPGGRPVRARRARHLLRAVRARRRGRPQAAPPPRVLLHAHRARAARPRGALRGGRAALRALRGRHGHPVHAQPAR